MAQAALTHNGIVEIKSKLGEHAQAYERLAKGERLTLNELIAIATYHEIVDRIRATRTGPTFKKIDYAVLRQHDRIIQDAIIGQLIDNIETLQDRSEVGSRYALLAETMRRYRTTPLEYIESLQGGKPRQEELRWLFRSAAAASVRDNLRSHFVSTALYDSDATLLREPTSKPNDRLNALLRQVDGKTALKWLNMLEEAMLCAGYGEDFDDCVDEITPDNVFSKQPVPYIDHAVERRRIGIQRQISEHIVSIAHARTLSDVAEAYRSVLKCLKAERVSVEQYLADFAPDFAREANRELFKRGALALVKSDLMTLVMKNKAMPALDIGERLRDPALRPSGQLDILFSNVGKETVSLLSVLEDAGFDLEEEGLAHRIITAEARLVSHSAPQAARPA